MKIQQVNIKELKPLEVNVRKHTETQIKELIRSVEHFGQTRAIVIDEDNNILIGNGLHEALMRMGMTKAFVYRKNGLSDIEKKKLILADNKTFSLGADDYDNIESYLEEIVSTGDYDIVGFDEDTLKSLLRQADEVLQDVQEYGILKTDEIKAKQNNLQKHEAAINNAVEDTSSQSPESNHHSDAYHHNANEPAKMIKTIICPNCGECIELN